MKRHTLNALAVSAFFLLGGLTLKAQETAAKPAPKNLAVEIVDDGFRGIQSPVLDSPSGGSMETSPPRRLPGWEQPAGVAPLTRIRINSSYEGDAVRIKVSVVFDDSEPADAPGPKYGEKEQDLATYLAREGETVKVEGLARFGFEPMRLKVVKAKPRPVSPLLASAPQVANKLKSVEVVSFEPDQSPTGRNQYKLRLRNVTEKDINLVDLYEAHASGRGGMTAEGAPGHPVIRAGDFYELNFHFSVGGHTTQQGYVHDAERQRTLTVGTVMFDDGTYEGEAEAAASFTASRRGGQIQRARVAPLLQSLLDAPSIDAPAAIEKLKAEVSGLRIDADPAVVAELRAQFPELTGVAVERLLTANVMSGLRRGREVAAHMIKGWEEMRARAPDTFDLRPHLSAFMKDIERRDARR